ncbi:MAG: hypothetical protein ABSH53_13390 [Holophaga sp.]|jgi:hypothetical protein
MRAKYLLIPLAAVILEMLACNGPMTGQQAADSRALGDPGFYSTKCPGGH